MIISLISSVGACSDKAKYVPISVAASGILFAIPAVDTVIFFGP